MKLNEELEIMKTKAEGSEQHEVQVQRAVK